MIFWESDGLIYSVLSPPNFRRLIRLIDFLLANAPPRTPARQTNRHTHQQRPHQPHGRHHLISARRSNSLLYEKQDHLGSIAAITDETGTVIERLAYDPWGKRRYPNGLGDKADNLVGVNTDRGYTLHEHLDEVGVIHMNGRVYDPLIGRFMSAAPFVQSPGNLQSYNRYAYVMNNPLAFTDPSGYISWKSITKVVKVAAVIAVAYYTGGAVAGSLGFGGATAGSAIAAATTGATATLTSAMAVGASMGFTAGFTAASLNGANFKESLKAGVAGGVTGAALGAASFTAAAWSTPSQIMAKSATSGAMAHLQGASFKNGFTTALIFASAAETYRSYVGFEATAEPGEAVKGNAAECGSAGASCYNFESEGARAGKIPASWESKGVVGVNEPVTSEDGFFNGKQGGWISRTLNQVPGINNVARLHDTFFSPNGSLSFTPINNVGSMLPAAAVSYSALFDLVTVDSNRCPQCSR